MSNTWQLQEAKAKLSQIVKQAGQSPQEITVHGKVTVVMISKKTYTALTEAKTSFVDFMQASPWQGLTLHLKRDKSLTRDVDL